MDIIIGKGTSCNAGALITPSSGKHPLGEFLGSKFFGNLATVFDHGIEFFYDLG